MEQFSHDLTLALEETSRVRAGHCWGGRRRTRSTGNLPCAPQPTEDSSSSPADGPSEMNDYPTNSILSDSDDRQNFKFALKSKRSNLFGNFESDSLNENFSPTRPSTRRKRKFKRMAVEYETTPSTPGNSTTNPIFPMGGNTMKKRVIKHGNQENFRASLFFCGKRKRSHRERYHDFEHYRLHSSSVPRQRDFYSSKGSYLEYKSRNRGLYSKSCERILPLNKSIVSKIERISQDSSREDSATTSTTTPTATHPILAFPFNSTCLTERTNYGSSILPNLSNVFRSDAEKKIVPSTIAGNQWKIEPTKHGNHLKLSIKSDSFESALSTQNSIATFAAIAATEKSKALKDNNSRRPSIGLNKKQRHRRRHQMKMQLQFDDPNEMECGNLNDFLSSSSLSSSDSETAATNESDHEGDDELTDWPGNEAMVNFASKNDFKRAKQPRPLPLKTQMKGVKEESIGQDDDTLMSADEFETSPGVLSPLGCAGPSSQIPPTHLNLQDKFMPTLGEVLTPCSTSILQVTTPTLPINIMPSSNSLHHVIESEMSGETSNHFLPSPNAEVREIRAGCRRIRDERPGFTIFSSVNEHLSKFMQDSHRTQLTLPFTDYDENPKLTELAKLYSLNIQVENGQAIFTKTINTTQAVKIDQSNMSSFFMSDYKRRCYGAEDDSESAEMAT